MKRNILFGAFLLPMGLNSVLATTSAALDQSEVRRVANAGTPASRSNKILYLTCSNYSEQWTWPADLVRSKDHVLIQLALNSPSPGTYVLALLNDRPKGYCYFSPPSGFHFTTVTNITPLTGAEYLFKGTELKINPPVGTPNPVQIVYYFNASPAYTSLIKHQAAKRPSGAGKHPLDEIDWTYDILLGIVPDK